MAVLVGWQERKSLPLPSTTGIETDLNFKVAVTFVAAKMNSDFSDIRFTDSDGVTLLSQYRESYVSETSAVWWIKVPSKPIAGKTVYMYYNNSSASLSSDGDSTFEFFDDFTGVNDDPPDTDKWTISENDYVKISDNTLKINITFAHLTQYAYGRTAFSEGYGIRFSAKKEQGGLGSMDVGWGESNASRYSYKEAALITDKWRYISTLVDASEIGDLTYHLFEIRMVTAFLKRYYFDNSEEHDSSATEETDDQNALFYMSGANPTDPMYIDWMFVFKLPAGGDEIADPVLGDEETIVSEKFIEPVSAKMKEILTDDLTARLTAIDTEYGDFTLDPINYIFEGRNFVFDQLPCINIWPDDSPGDDLDNNKVVANHKITVYIVAVDDDQERLHKRIWRYQRAIVEAIKATEDLEETATNCFYAGQVYDSPWGIEDGNSYLEIGGVMFDIDKEETP